MTGSATKKTASTVSGTGSRLAGALAGKKDAGTGDGKKKKCRGMRIASCYGFALYTSTSIRVFVRFDIIYALDLSTTASSCIWANLDEK